MFVAFIRTSIGIDTLRGLYAVSIQTSTGIDTTVSIVEFYSRRILQLYRYCNAVSSAAGSRHACMLHDLATQAHSAAAAVMTCMHTRDCASAFCIYAKVNDNVMPSPCPPRLHVGDASSSGDGGGGQHVLRMQLWRWPSSAIASSDNALILSHILRYSVLSAKHAILSDTQTQWYSVKMVLRLRLRLSTLFA